MKTIFFITNNYVPYSGGVTRSIQTWQQALTEHGYCVYIITFDFLGVQHADEDGVLRIPTVMRFTYKKNHMAIAYKSSYYIKQMVRSLKPDIIHVHHPFLLGKVGLKVSHGHKIPIVFTYHTQYEHYAHYVPLPQLVTKPLLVRYVNYFCNRVDRIIAPSDTIKNILQHRAINKPIDVVPTPVDRQFFQSVQKNIEQPVIYLLTVSRFVAEKNIPFLLRVFKKLNRSRYVLTLVGYGNQLAALQHYAYVMLELSRAHVVFVEKPEPEFLRTLYAQAHVFVFASTTETQGMVLVEAMASSVPVIALHGPGSSDIIQDGYNGWLVSTENQMQQRIEQLCTDPVRYEQFSCNAYATAQRYDAALLTPKLVQLYQETISYF